MEKSLRLRNIGLILLSLIILISFTPLYSSASSKSVSVQTGSYYTIKNVGSGKMLNVYGSSSRNNSNITVYQADRTSGQDFSFSYNSTYGGYTIVPRCATSRALNVYGYSAGNGSNVCTWTKSGSDTQTWIIESVSNGYLIRCANNTNYVLTATGSSNSSNVNIQRYSSSNSYQVWTSSAFSTTTSSSSTSSGSITTSQIQNVLDQYGYRTGKYWTYPSGGRSTSGYTASSRYGRSYSYNYKGSVECAGFAAFVMSKVTGTYAYETGNGWSKIAGRNVTSLQVGDVIRTSGHSAVVLAVDSNGNCTFAECWGSVGCKINIGKFNGSYSTLSQIKNRYTVSHVWRYNG